jgi:hypothetical protein
MLEGGGGPTGIAVLLRLHRAPPSPRGPQCAQSPRWGGRLETVIPVWKLSSLSSNTHRYGWPPPGLYYLSVRRDFRPGLSSASRGSGVTKLGHSLRLLPRGYTVTLVFRAWASLASHVVQGEPVIRAPCLCWWSQLLLRALHRQRNISYIRRSLMKSAVS